MYTINSNDIYGFANSINADVREKGNELFFKRCPYCQGGMHDDDTFSINIETGVFKCFRSTCGKQGHFVELARDFNYPLDFGISPSKKYRQLNQKKIVVRDKAVEFMKTRGISEEITKKYEITTQTNNENIIVFPFFDENGVMVSAKYRKSDFDKSKDKCKEWFERDTKPVLFGIKQCVNYDRLIITEGQIDSLSVAESGIDNAVSVPTGAGGMTWANHCYDWVNRFSEIIIFGDYEKGKISLVDGVSSRFPNKLIKIVRQEDYLGEKDANDILRKYGKDAIKKCVENAEIKPVRAVKRLCDVKKVDLYSLEHIKTGIYELDRAIAGLYFGQVYLLTGRRGEGKSTLASQIMANAIEQGYRCFAYSGELPDYHFKSWLDLQIAGTKNICTVKDEYGEEQYFIADNTVDIINEWYSDKAYIYDNAAVLDELAVNGKIVDGEETTLLGVMQQAVCRYGIKLVILDNLMTALDVEPNTDLYRSQSEFIKKVKRLATLLNIAVIVIAHPRKDGGELDCDSVSGSADITNAVDVVITYSKNEDEATAGEYQSLIGVKKNRLTGKKREGNNRIKARYSQKSKRITCDRDSDVIYSCFKQKTSEKQFQDDFLKGATVIL